jgi:AcrR family transcriptional regulator
VPKRSDTRAPQLDRDAVVDAALALVARDGFGALSMRRVAADLGVGTMSLYWYVPTREDLVDLMVDRAIRGQLLDAVPADWRSALEQIARAARDAVTANAWLRDAHTFRRLGVSVLAHIDQSIEAVEGIELPFAHRMAAVSIVDTYVRGWVLEDRDAGDRDADGGLQSLPPLTDEAAEQLAAGAFPRFAEIIAQDWAAADWRAAQAFEVGLAVVLDGIEAAVARGRMPTMPMPAPLPDPTPDPTPEATAEATPEAIES